MTLKLLTFCATANDGSMPFMSAFQRVLATPGTPARTGYWLGKLHKVLVGEVEEFTKARIKRLCEVGTPVEGTPGQFHIPANKIEAFVAEIAAMDRDVDLGLPDELKLQLPPVLTPEDWMPLMSELDIFEEPK